MEEFEVVRSLRCCKRRSVMKDLQSFGRRWQRSRQRIGVVFPSTKVSGECASLVRALAFQGHSVTVYCVGVQSPEVRASLGTSPVRLRTGAVPRMFRIFLEVMTSAIWGEESKQGERVAVFVYAVLLALRVVVGSLILYVYKQLSTILGKSTESRPYMYDVGIFFLRPDVAEFCLRRLCRATVAADEETWKFLDLARISKSLRRRVHCRHRLVWTDLDAEKWPGARVIYPPFDVGTSKCSTLSTNFFGFSGEFFVSLPLSAADAQLAVDAFILFIADLNATPDEGITATAALPRLVVMLQSEINVTEISDPAGVVEFVLLSRNCTTTHQKVVGRKFSEICSACVALLNTPTLVNDVATVVTFMEFAKPVISTIARCTVEPLRANATGVLAKAKTPTAVKEALTTFWRAKADWSRLGTRGKQRAETEFCREIFANRLDEFVEEILA